MCGTHARGYLINGLPFQLYSFNEVKTLNNKPFLLQHPNHKQNPMARYRRNFIADGTFFFTVKLADPKSRLLVEQIDLLRAAYMDVQKQYPFETVAVCILPNHIHATSELKFS